MDSMKSYPQGELFFCWATIRPAEDAAGQWVGHCLDMDVVSQGNSPLEAIEMVMEATTMVAADDLLKGRNPLDRRAPREEWLELARLQEKCQPVENLDKFLAEQKGQGLCLVLQFTVAVDLVSHKASEPRRVRGVPALACQQAAC
jgi:predicted RNase H-like HicB family nuclease